jgi:hypothetical protein
VVTSVAGKYQRYADHLSSVLYSLLQALEVADFCSINSRPGIPIYKNLGSLKQVSEQAMLLVHLVLFVVPEKRSILPVMKEEH